MVSCETFKQNFFKGGVAKTNKQTNLLNLFVDDDDDGLTTLTTMMTTTRMTHQRQNYVIIVIIIDIYKRSLFSLQLKSDLVTYAVLLCCVVLLLLPLLLSLMLSSLSWKEVVS